ncbi:hypothetical protein Ancab_023630 [Ancistrocladus abbreviatus]
MAKQVDKLLLFLIISFFALSGKGVSKVAAARTKNGGLKLFVFGDSYADTGNWNKSIAASWKVPYGMTYPGKPAGRFSDGRILTDYIASHYGISPPVPYELRNSAGIKESGSGINFAYGGTGVFNTSISEPNITTQISFFQQLIDAKAYTKPDLLASFALVSVCGNDYGTFLKSGGSQKSLAEFTKSVINQLVSDLKSIHALGVPKVAVTALEPMGCLPAITIFSSYKSCNDKINAIAQSHNQLLVQSVEQLNNQSGQPTFFIVDLYDAFKSAIQMHQNQRQAGGRNLQYEDALTPCCQGVSSDFECGSKEGDQVKYTICKKPELSFFWDLVHPAQNGWHGVYLAIRFSLPQLYGM